MPNAFHLLNAGQMQLYHQNSLNSPSTPTQLTANGPTGSASAAAATIAATLSNLGNLNQLSQLAAANSLLPMTSSLSSSGFNSSVTSSSSSPFNLASFNTAAINSSLAMSAASAPLSPDQNPGNALTGDSKRILQSLTAGLAGQLALAAQQQQQQYLPYRTSKTTVSSVSTCTSPSVSAVESSHSITSDHYTSSHYSQQQQRQAQSNNQRSPLTAGSCSSPLVEDSRTLSAVDRKPFDLPSNFGTTGAAASLLTAATAPNLGLLNELLAFYDVRKMYENLPYLNALYPALLANNNNNNNNNHNNNNNLNSNNTDNHSTSTSSSGQQQQRTLSASKSSHVDTPLDLSMALKDEDMGSVDETVHDADVDDEKDERENDDPEDEDDAMDDLSEADRLALNADDCEPSTGRKHKSALDLGRVDSCGESVALDQSLSSKSSCFSAPAQFGCLSTANATSGSLSTLHSPPDSPLSSAATLGISNNDNHHHHHHSLPATLSPLLANGHPLLNSNFTAQLTQQQQQQLLSTLSVAAAAAAAVAANHSNNSIVSNTSLNGLTNHGSSQSPNVSQRSSPAGSPRIGSPSNAASPSLHGSFNMDPMHSETSDQPFGAYTSTPTPSQLNQLGLSLKNELMQTLQKLRSLNGDEKQNSCNGLLALSNQMPNGMNSNGVGTPNGVPPQQLTLNGNVKLTLDPHCDTLAALQTAAAVVAAKKVLVVDDPIASAVCGKTTILKKPRVRTMLPCEYCRKSFDRPSLLRRHLRTHTGEKPHVCDVCKKGFSTSSSLNTHRRIHSGEKPHQCSVCQKRFTASSNLYYHRMTHTKDKPHKCNLCSKSFPTPGDLKSHMYVHNGSWPFKCQICNRGFSKQTNLRNHMFMHTSK